MHNNLLLDLDQTPLWGELEIETKIKMVPYEEKLKDSVFAFTEKCFEELGKKFEPDGRHSFYNDIEGYFEVFFHIPCL